MKLSDENSIVKKFLEERASESKTTWDIEKRKAAPGDYIRSLLEEIYPTATKIEDVRKYNITGTDWKVYLDNDRWDPLRPRKLIEVFGDLPHELIVKKIDDKTDRKLGYTGNIFLDHGTLFVRDCVQLFVTPNFRDKYLVIYNELLDPDYVITNSFTTTRRTTKTKSGSFVTKGYPIKIKKIKHAIVLAKPSIDWFMIKREEPEKRASWS